MRKRFLSFIFAICLMMSSLIITTACDSSDDIDFTKENFSFTFLGTTVSKSDRSTIINDYTVYLFTDINYRDLSKYDASNPGGVYDIDRYGNITLTSYTYTGKYKIYSNPMTATGTSRIELNPNQTNKVYASMGVDQYKKVIDFYVYGDDSDTSYRYSIFIIFADSQTL